MVTIQEQTSTRGERVGAVLMLSGLGLLIFSGPVAMYSSVTDVISSSANHDVVATDSALRNMRLANVGEVAGAMAFGYGAAKFNSRRREQ